MPVRETVEINNIKLLIQEHRYIEKRRSTPHEMILQMARRGCLTTIYSEDERIEYHIVVIDKNSKHHNVGVMQELRHGLWSWNRHRTFRSRKLLLEAVAQIYS